MIVYMAHPNIICNFLMSIIAKRQPLHRPSIQSPPFLKIIPLLDPRNSKNSQRTLYVYSPGIVIHILEACILDSVTKFIILTWDILRHISNLL